MTNVLRSRREKSMTNVLRSRIAYVAIAGMLAAPLAFAAPVDDAVAELARDWADIKYKVPANEQAAKYEALANRAHKVSATYPDRAEPLVWEGIIVSSFAGAKGAGTYVPVNVGWPEGKVSSHSKGTIVIP